MKDTTTTSLKVDLHVHSKFSDAPFSWFLRAGKAAECYTSVDKVYEVATKRGMDLVTISDHDTIEGALDLVSKYPDNTFISEEVSARFPEDGCIVHTIVLNITEAQHDEIQRLRRNIYELIPYLNGERIAYYWCHPLSQVNRRLTTSHIERCLLMFNALELRNGTRDVEQEQNLLATVNKLGPSVMSLWAERHRDVPIVNPSGSYAFVGGSDDHGSIAIARAYTEFDGVPTGDSLASAVRAAKTRVGGECGRAETLAHNCYGVAAGWVKSTGQFGGKQEDGRGGELSMSMVKTLGRYKSLLQDAGFELDSDELWRDGHTTGYQQRLGRAVNEAQVVAWRQLFDDTAAALKAGRVSDAADNVGGLLKGLLFELPYILASRWHVRDRRGSEKFRNELGIAATRERRLRIGVVTDTIDEINGVALGLRRLAAEARRWSFDLRLISAGDGARVTVDDEGIVRIPGIYAHRMPEQPDYAWTIPHLPSMLRYLSEANIDLIQCSTPGPMGVAALIAGRLTGIPVVGQYHTDVPEYALRLTGDPTVADFVNSLVGRFYAAMDRVLVPSVHAGEIVRSMAVPSQKIRQIPRGVDLGLFANSQRNKAAFEDWGLNGEPKLLYVGRLSKEKSIHQLLAAFERVRRPDARLVLVGDGPMTPELRRARADGKLVLTGPQHGARLAELYASADVFVFPSETETFGNVVVEAQASGVPVIVSRRGAACEHMVEGVTGFAVDIREPAQFGLAIERMLNDDAMRASMGEEAARFARRYDMVEAVRGTFKEYASILNDIEGPTWDNSSPSELARAS